MSDINTMLEKYKNSGIAIYGLGTETERVLAELSSEFHVIGLLDGYKTEGMLYGRPIISLEQAAVRQAGLILVAARPGSCRAIEKRIGKFCARHQIDLMDIRGRNLCSTKEPVYQLHKQAGLSKKNLLAKIAQNQIVSFDLFDTLLMRQALFVTDVLDLADCRLKRQGIIIEDFQKKRLQSEKELAKHTAPALAEIYRHMKRTYHLSDLDPEEAARLEFEIDYELAVPRKEVCDLFAEICRQGKEVYIVSDSYYTKQQLIMLLNKINISGYRDIFDSCEFGTGKTQKLFDRLKAAAGGRSCIHIGDDIAADVESAKKNGLKAVQLFSGMDLFELTGYMGMWEQAESLADRIKIGMFIAKMFNSPFQFEEGREKISVDDAYEIGYLFSAPMITDFTIWLHRKVTENKLNNILFCARDGYLLKKLYDELVQNKRSVYFLTSRTAAIRAGVENEDDIQYVEEMKFSGTLSEQLRERFGIEGKKGKDKKDEKNGGKSLLDYTEAILKKAVLCRKGYQAYIDRLGLQDGDAAFFDFVAKGTSQMFLERLFDNHLKGFYFLQLEKQHMKEKNLDIQPFYEAEEMDDSAVFEDYYILETMLTAPSPSVKEINAAGLPVFDKETRTDEDISCFQSAQDGIFDYFKDYIRLCPKEEWKINKKLDEIMLSLIHRTAILNRSFLNLKVEDPFFNRMTDITDLL